MVLSYSADIMVCPYNAYYIFSRFSIIISIISIYLLNSCSWEKVKGGIEGSKLSKIKGYPSSSFFIDGMSMNSLHKFSTIYKAFISFAARELSCVSLSKVSF